VISLLSSLPALPEPLMGCRIETLYACYAALPAAVDLYKSGSGGILCRFGGRLLISGGVDACELQSFVRMTGVLRAEGLDRDIPALAGCRQSRHTLLTFSGKGAALPRDVDDDPDPRRVFALLCQADANFARHARYLPWLSDLCLRRRKNRARVYLLENAATVCVSAMGCGAGYISSVAVDAGRRGRGLGGALVRAAAQALCAGGMLPVTAAQSASLDGFYERLGFIPVETQSVSAVHSEVFS
jgi:ribosomal protein S18 acetylase RimI-like enzyme